MPIRYSPPGSGSSPRTTENPLTVALAHLNPPPVGPERGDTFQVSATWSREVVAFTGGSARAFTISNGLIDNVTQSFTSPDSTVYTITITPPEDTEGLITYLVPADSAAAEDDGTPGPIQQQTISVRYNVLKPALLWAWNEGRAVTGNTITIAGTWNQAVQGFLDSDLTINWADENMMTGTVALTHNDGDTSSSMLITFPQDSRGSVTITVNADAVNASGIGPPLRTGPTQAYTLTVDYDGTTGGGIIDSTPPTLTISPPTVSPWRNRAATIEFLWSERVNGFTQGDITLPSNVTKGALESVPGDGNVIQNDQLFRLPVTFPASFNQTFAITVPAMTVTDVAGNANAVATTEMMTVDTRPQVSGFTNEDGTTATQICAETFAIDANPYIHDSMGNAAGGYFLGVLEMEKIGDDIYMVVQIQRKRDGRDEPAFDQEAAGALVHVSTTSMACTVIERYSHITLAPRSMTVHNGELYLYYSSHYIYVNPPDREPDWREQIAYIRKIVSTNRLELVARPYRYRARISNSENVEVGWAGGTASPMLSVGDELHWVSGYDNFENIRDLTSDAAKYDNNFWQVLRQKLNRRLPRFTTNDRLGWDILKEIAFLTDSIIGFDDQGFFMRERSTVQASLSGDIPATGSITSIVHAGRNRDFPSGAGRIAINGEVFQYTDVDTMQFTGITRAADRTQAMAHMGGSTIYYIDNVVRLDDSSLYKPIQEMDISLNTRHNYSKIRLIIGTQDDDSQFFDPVVIERPTSSTTPARENVFERELPLSRHQAPFAEFLADKLWARLGRLQYRIVVEMKLTLYLKIGDYVFLDQNEKAHLRRVCQVAEIQHHVNKGAQHTVLTLITI